MFFLKKRIYLDYASTTPVAEEVISAMKPYWRDLFYNASSIYREGVEAKRILTASREIVTKHINCRAEDIIYTSGGTEANNIAILGIARKAKETIKTPHIITTLIEHPSILEACKQAQREGIEVTYLPVEADGRVNLQGFKDSLKIETVLVSIMMVSNEIGVIEPIKEIARAVKLWKTTQGREPQAYPYVHTDASQAPNYLSIDREPLGVDMMTLDASKIYGPKGVGILYKKSFIELVSLTFGGGQEKGIRSGTESLFLVVGFAEALNFVAKNRKKEVARLSKLQTYFFDELMHNIPSSNINGSREYRIPNNVNICIPGINAEFTVIQLDSLGVACSFATTCKNLTEDSSSYVVKALNGSNCASSSLRFTMGIATTSIEIDKTIQALRKCLITQKIPE